MTIKKPMNTAPTVKAAVPGAETQPAAPAAGGATIADRFKLDITDPSAKKSAPAGKGAMVAVVAGVIALAVAGILAFILLQHWDFLKAA